MPNFNFKIRLSADHIVYTLALANAARLGWVYATADAQGNVFSLPGFAGILIGLSISVAVAFVSGKLPKLSGPRKFLAWVAFLCTIALEPAILAPLTRADMTPRLVAITDWYAWPWAVFVSILPSVVLAAVSFVNGEGLIGISRQDKPVSGSQPAASGASGVVPLKCSICGATTNKRGLPILTRNALNAHMREHNKKTVP